MTMTDIERFCEWLATQDQSFKRWYASGNHPAIAASILAGWPVDQLQQAYAGCMVEAHTLTKNYKKLQLIIETALRGQASRTRPDGPCEACECGTGYFTVISPKTLARCYAGSLDVIRSLSMPCWCLGCGPEFTYQEGLRQRRCIVRTLAVMDEFTERREALLNLVDGAPLPAGVTEYDVGQAQIIREYAIAHGCLVFNRLAPDDVEASVIEAKVEYFKGQFDGLDR